MVQIIDFLTKIFEKLPQDPFVSFLRNLNEALNPYLGYLNWIIPFQAMANITAAWVVAVLAANALMYLYNIFIKKIAG